MSPKLQKKGEKRKTIKEPRRLDEPTFFFPCKQFATFCEEMNETQDGGPPRESSEARVAGWPFKLG